MILITCFIVTFYDNAAEYWGHQSSLVHDERWQTCASEARWIFVQIN